MRPSPPTVAHSLPAVTYGATMPVLPLAKPAILTPGPTTSSVAWPFRWKPANVNWAAAIPGCMTSMLDAPDKSSWPKVSSTLVVLLPCSSTVPPRPVTKGLVSEIRLATTVPLLSSSSVP